MPWCIQKNSKINVPSIYLQANVFLPQQFFSLHKIDISFSCRRTTDPKVQRPIVIHPFRAIFFILCSWTTGLFLLHPEITSSKLLIGCNYCVYLSRLQAFSGWRCRTNIENSKISYALLYFLYFCATYLQTHTYMLDFRCTTFLFCSIVSPQMCYFAALQTTK